MSDLLTDMIGGMLEGCEAIDCPFDADESREMTGKEKVAEARRLRSEGVALAKQATELKSQAKEYHPAIFEYLEELGTDKINIDGKALSMKEVEEWSFPQEHKREIIQWCIDNDRWEFLDVPTAKFKTACKASVEAEMDLPPHAEIKTFNKLNGV